MPSFEVTSPDGRKFQVTAPDDATEEQVLAYAQQQFASSANPPKPQPELESALKSDNLKQTALGVLDNLVGSGLRDRTAGAVRGAGSIGATLLAPIDVAADAFAGKGLSLESNRQRRADMDSALAKLTGANTNSGNYQVGKILAEIAGTAGAGNVAANTLRAVSPSSKALAAAIESGGFRTGVDLTNASKAMKAADAATRIAGGTVSGGVTAGAIDPTHADTGMMWGAALPVAVKGGGALTEKVGELLTVGGKNRELAKQAIEKHSIPLGLGDVSENATTKAFQSILNDMPLSGMVGASRNNAKQEAFNKAVGATFGAPEAKLTADVVDTARKRMGAEFDRVWNNNVLQVDGPMIQRLIALRQEAAKMPKNEGDSIAAEINDLLSKVTSNSSGAAIIPGDVANKFQSYLRRKVEGSSGLKNELGDLRKTIIEAFNRNVRPEDAAALAKNMAQYKSFKTVEPILNKGEAGVAGREAGDVAAALLPQAVASSYSRAAGTPLAELSQIGSKFLVDRVPRTGGSSRAWLQNSILGTAATAASPVAALANMLMTSPSLAKRALSDSQASALAQLLMSPEATQLGARAAPILLTSGSGR